MRNEVEILGLDGYFQHRDWKSDSLLVSRNILGIFNFYFYYKKNIKICYL